MKYIISGQSYALINKWNIYSLNLIIEILGNIKLMLFTKPTPRL